MRNRLWQLIWGTGRGVCPVCYRQIWDSVTHEDYVEWLCHHCETETDEPAYSWYWPFDVILPRISYWAYMKQKTRKEEQEG
jgi:ribosomal protein L37AE/L43A